MTDLKTRRVWKVDHKTAAVALLYIGEDALAGAEAAEILSSVMQRKSVQKRIDALLNLELLEAADRESALLETNARWASRGWGDAFDYLLATWDYPFENYAAGGQARDEERMERYESESPDNVRYLPAKGELRHQIATVREGLERHIARAEVSEADLLDATLDIASAVTQPVEWRASRTGGADHMLRVSPSGGARHPAEVYLIALNVPGLDRGVYHVSVGDAALAWVGEAPSNEDLQKNMPGAYRLDAEPRVIFVVTLHVARNMYRYREPRTFRTIFLDAGHMGGLIEALCDSRGMTAHGHHGFNDTFVGELLKCGDLTKEVPAYLVSVALEDDCSGASIKVGESVLNS
ncbi:SagB/ThcOx family dehydrogenase [Nanchangia anserum]|uniref:SagB/ThcOx family dehydrogenase n=1 Tax=Nanchangia anserum TaxID=2692125 RepID=A0A8I0G7Q9_9ACTO|nr:SagB/ThcOx family dehydrogenase [Nanchangia anserum]MBD3689387.1 SagB/ThcOx family dehydrogenase [Nanchangia anserum]QOX81594.1 SagB/ThcOx family dehydrogenase [Nanchangia anserum]